MRGKDAGGVERRLTQQRLFNGGHAEGERVLLLAELGVVGGEVVDAVLLAEGAKAEHEDPGHEEELREALLPLQRICHQPQRLP